MAMHESVKKMRKDIFRKDQRENIQLPVVFEDIVLVFVNVLKAPENMWDVNVKHIRLGKHHTEVIKERLRPRYSDPYRAGLIGRQFVAVETNQMIVEKVIKPETTIYTALTVFLASDSGLLRF